MAESSPKRSSQECRDKRYDVCSKRLVLTEAGLRALDNHKYQPGTYTPIDNLLNKYLWTPGAEFLPLWMAPNLVTLIGFSFVLSGFVLQGAYSTDFGENEIPPRWVNAIVSFNIFVYQTMDAMDGKQARRTGTSSPLGQLFDHGVDAMSTSVLGFMTLTALGIGINAKAAAVVFSSLMAFWFAQWGEYHTHTLNHSFGFFGTTEAQLLTIFSVAGGAIFGTETYQQIVPGTPLSIGDTMVAGGVVCGLFLSASSVKTVVTAKNVNLAKASIQTIPIFTLVTIGCAWSAMPQKHPRLVLGTCGIVFTYLTLLMVLCAMTQMDYAACPSILWPMPVLFLVDLYHWLPDWSDLLLGMYFSYAGYKTYKFITYSIYEITSHLNINCLTIPYKPEGESTKDK